MAAAKRIYNDIDEILGVVLESDSSDIDLDDDNELDTDWEYESGDEEGQFEPPQENFDDPDPVVDPPPPAEHAVDGSEVGEEESNYEGNRSPVEEITEESITESSSEDDEPLARLRQRALPNNRGGRRRGRNCGQGRGRPIGLRRIRRGRRYSIEGPAVPEQEQQDLPVGGQRQGFRRGGGARASGHGVRRGRGCSRERPRAGAPNNDQPKNDGEFEDLEGDLEWTNVNISDEVTENFLEEEGLNVRLDPANSTKIDFLELYLTDEIYELIVQETNRFAAQYIASNPDKEDNKYVGSWNDVTKEELKVFLGVVIMMGIIHKPNVNFYWSLDELLATPSFSQMMLRDRFKLILKFLHFNTIAPMILKILIVIVYIKLDRS